MPTKIHLLPDIIANQIAAGEVVQRPASVVKELLENALDAGATEIKLIIKDGGKTLIQVIDNGEGMAEIDARMCFERHATSKITNSEDLFQLTTYGFRGEAMSSIAAVGEVELSTRTKDQELGTYISIEESVVKKQELIQTPIGTNIKVHYLFRKVPARRNFLKSNAIETKHIIDEFQRVALARPDIAFHFYQDKHKRHQLPATQLNHRIIHLLGKNYQSQLIPCEETTETLSIKGYIGTPKQAKKTRGEQFFFVNGRYIKSPYLHHAIKKAFLNLIPEKSFPFYIIFITVAPDQVDINVHPTKTEVKLQEEKLLYAVITTSAKKSLATHHLIPTIDFEPNTVSTLFPFQGASASIAPSIPSKASTTPPQSKPLFTGNKQKKATNSSSTPLKKISWQDQQELLPTNLQLHKKYILAQVKSGLLIIDQTLAHERILYEKSKASLTKAPNATQQLIFPTEITLPPTDLSLVQVCKENLYALGFRYQILPPHTVSITGQPSNIPNIPMKELLIDLLAQYKTYAHTHTLPQVENWARCFAKRASMKEGTPLSNLEMNSMINQLFVCEDSYYTPDGIPIWRIMTLESLTDFLLHGNT